MYNTLREMQDRLRPHALPLALLCIVTLAVYLPSLGHEFQVTWDDSDYVTANTVVRGFNLAHIKAAFGTTFVGNYAPLHIISYMLDYEIWGMRAGGFIFSNIALHLANGLLFYRLLLMLAFSRLATFLAAFIFLLHPVQVESVVWISERKNLLAMLFFLASFIWYVRYSRLQPGGAGRGRLYALSLTAFACALLSKAVAVVLPVALILYNFCYRPLRNHKPPGAGATWRQGLTDKIPFLLLALLMGVITIFAQNPDSSGRGGLTGYHGGGPFQTFLTMLPVMVMYLRLLFLPTNLSAVYAPPIRQGIDPVVAGSAALCVLLAAAGFLLFRKRRDLAFWYFLFFLSLGPVSQIIPLITLMNDRYLYFPLLGGAALAGYGVARHYSFHPSGETSPPDEWRPGWRFILVALPLLALPYLSLKRSAVWQDSRTLWKDAVAKTTVSYPVFRLADAYRICNDMESAKKLLQAFLARHPRDERAQLTLAQILLQQKDVESSRRLLLSFTAAHPDNALGYQGLGDASYMLGDMRNAEIYYRKALAIKPDLPRSLLPLANILLARRDLSGADIYLTQALRFDDKNPEIYYSLACVRSLEGKKVEALKWFETALKLGYKNRKSILENKELDSVRSMPGFGALIGRYFK